MNESHAIIVNRPIRPRPLSCILLFFVYGGYFGALGFFLAVLLPIFLALSPVPPLRASLMRITLRAFLRYLAFVHLQVLQIIRIVECSGFDGRPAGAAIYVANHRSSIDGLMLLPLIGTSAVVLKPKHARKPVFRALVKLLDFVNMDTSSMTALAGAIDKCRRQIREGRSLLVFPEGSRTTAGRLHPFKDFAFRLAIELGVPVVPVIIHSDLPFLNREPGSWFTHQRIHFRIRCLEARHPAPGEDPPAFAHRIHQHMARELAALDRAIAPFLSRSGGRQPAAAAIMPGDTPCRTPTSA